MIDRLHVENFKCLRDTTVEFSPLTVLIGPNDSGKTSILEAIEILGLTASSPLPQIFEGARSIANITWRQDRSLTPSWELRATASRPGGAQSVAYDFAMPSAGPPARDSVALGNLRATRTDARVMVQGIGQIGEGPNYSSLWHAMQRENIAPEFGAAAASFSASGIYRFDPRALRKPSVPTQGAVLSRTGDNLAAVLDGLLSGPDRDAVNQMEASLRQAVPTLAGFSTPPAEARPGREPPAGAKTIRFLLASKDRQRITIPCALASDGAMLRTAFLALAYSDTPEVLLIEEPENGLHPQALVGVMALLRQMSKGEVGNKPRQIILTTHSPLLLNQVEPDEVRLVVRDSEEGTKVKRMSEVPGLDELRKELDLGEIWYLLGERDMFQARTPQ